jgi:hypothetical protein
MGEREGRKEWKVEAWLTVGWWASVKRDGDKLKQVCGVELIVK